jgi:hypothetical protein
MITWRASLPGSHGSLPLWRTRLDSRRGKAVCGEQGQIDLLTHAVVCLLVKEIATIGRSAGTCGNSRRCLPAFGQIRTAPARGGIPSGAPLGQTPSRPQKTGAKMEGQQHLTNRSIEYPTSTRDAVWRFSVHDNVFGSSMGEKRLTWVGRSRVHLDHSAYNPRHTRDGCGAPQLKRPRVD